MDLIGFALAILVIELTPGPNMAWLAGLAATEGRRSGLAAVAGVAVGLLLNGALAALGLAALLQAAPGLWQLLRLAGAAMMGWLAIDAWRGADGRPPIVPTGPVARRAFATGVLVNLLNPKAYMVFVMVAPQFLNGQRLSPGNALLLAAISTIIATAIHAAIVLGKPVAGLAGRSRANPAGAAGLCGHHPGRGGIVPAGRSGLMRFGAQCMAAESPACRQSTTPRTFGSRCRRCG